MLSTATPSALTRGRVLGDPAGPRLLGRFSSGKTTAKRATMARPNGVWTRAPDSQSAVPHNAR